MRTFNLTVLGLAAISFASAANIAPVEVGQIIGGVNYGLTSAYVTGGCMGTSCIAGNNSGFSSANYDTTLWAGATLTSPTPFNGYGGASTETTAGSTITDPNSGGPTFAMISDSSNPTGNYWNSGNASATTSITIPVGVFGTEQVWTMLNDRWGQTATDTTVTFNFSSDSAGLSGLTSVAVSLAGSNTSPYGQIRGAVDCGVNGATLCKGYAQDLASGATTINGVPVTSENVFNTSYTYGTGHGNFSTSSGSLVLDDQNFNFSNYVFASGALAGLSAANVYLVDIVVTDTSGVNKVNNTALSAITLDVATPEPSTWLMLGTGIGLLGFKLRRRK